MSKFSCALSAALFGQIAHAISREETRYYLNGVNVEPCPQGGAILVATDGSQLVVLRDPDAVVKGSAIVSLSPDMLKACRAKSANTLFVKGAQAMVSPGSDYWTKDLEAFDLQQATATQFRDVIIDGSFPEWRRVVPSKIGNQRVDPFGFEVLSKVVKALGGDKVDPVRIMATLDDGGPHVVTVGDALDGFGIMMPQREQGSKAFTFPTWLAPAKAPKLRKAA